MRSFFRLGDLTPQHGREPPVVWKGVGILLILTVVGVVLTVGPQPKQAASCSVLAVTNTSNDFASAADVVGSRCVVNVEGLSDTHAAVAVKQKADQVNADEVVTMGGTLAFPATKNKVIAQAVNRTVMHVGGQDRYATKNMLKAAVRGRSVYQVAQLEDSGRIDYPVHRVSCPYEANRTSYCYAIPHFGGAIVGAAQYRYTPPVIHWRLRLAVSDHSRWIRQSVTITARTSYKLSGTPYYINIWRGNHLLRTCSSGTVCSVRDRRNTPGAYTYHATVSDYRSERHTQDRSNTETVRWRQPNRPPRARFGFSPARIYNDTRVTFHNQSSDPDGDRLRYRWQYQKPGSRSWRTFSAHTNTRKVLNQKGTWQIRLIATDPDGARDLYMRSVSVRNRTPVARFTVSPAMIYDQTQVTFRNQSSDRDGDRLSYRWQYQKPHSWSWRTFFTRSSTSKVLNQKGTWRIRLIVTDPNGARDSYTRAVTVRNRAPVARFRYWPTLPVVGEAVHLVNQSEDPDDTQLSFTWDVQGPGGRHRHIKGRKNPVISFDQAGHWLVTLHVGDPYGGTDTTSNPIKVKHVYQAAVRHTPSWQQKRQKAHFNRDDFLPGEAFLLTATADAHATSAKVLSPFDVGKQEITLKQKTGEWQALLHSPHFDLLKKDTYTFTFVFHFDDGQIKKVNKTIQIAGQLHLRVHLTQ